MDEETMTIEELQEVANVGDFGCSEEEMDSLLEAMAGY